jgi:hypothetical protein
LADFCKTAGKRVVGYYDAFSFNRFSNPSAEMFQNALTHLITPTLDSARFFQQRFSNIPSANIVALGQPTLEETAQTIQRTNRLALSQKLGIDPNQPTLLFVGGYGSSYPEAFALFCETIRQFPQANILLSLHPKADGQLEKTLLQQAQLDNRIRLVPPDVSTIETLAVTDVVMAHNSTVSSQALLQGKKVVLLGSVPGTDFDPIHQYQAAPRCETSLQLVQALAQAIPEAMVSRVLPPNEQQISRWYQLFGLPQQASQRITQFLITASGRQPMQRQSLVA